MQLRKRISKEIYIEAIRVIAIFLVIFNHTDGYYLYYSNTDNPLTWWFSCLGSVLCRSNVPLFIMITGALLLEKKEPIKVLYKKRICRMAVVLVIFSFFYYMLSVFRNPEKEFSLLDFLKGLLNGSIQESFWYLYLYLGLLMLLPLLRKMAAACTDNELRYLVLLQFIMGTGAGIFSFVTGVQVNDNLYILNIYVFYLLAGCYLGKRTDMCKVPKSCIIGSFVLTVLCLAGTCAAVRMGWHRDRVYNQEVLNLLTPIQTFCVFLDIRWICWKCDGSGKTKERYLQKLICEAGSCVFGIYLLEQLARIQLLPLYLYLSKNTVGVLACICYVFGSFLLAWVYTEILKRVPLLGRLL